MMLFALALSRTPSSSSHVMSMTIANAGTLMSMGTPATWGALSISACTLGSELSSAVR